VDLNERWVTDLSKDALLPSFRTYIEARSYCEQLNAPLVIKRPTDLEISNIGLVIGGSMISMEDLELLYTEEGKY